MDFMCITFPSVFLNFDAYLPVVKILPHILRHDYNKVIDILVFVRRYTCVKIHTLISLKVHSANATRDILTF